MPGKWGGACRARPLDPPMPTTRDHHKTNKLANRKYNNEVNESEIKTSNLDQVQQFFNEDADVVFDALVAADYIDEIDCTDSTRQPSS